MQRFFEENNVHLRIEDGDLEIMKRNTVDYLTCSYYQSAVYKKGEALTSDTGGSMEKRCGFVFVDYDDNRQGTGKLYRKKSFDWYRNVIATRGASLFED